jgi:hypothetical protein
MLDMILQMMQPPQEAFEGMEGDPVENLKKLYPKLCNAAYEVIGDIKADMTKMAQAVNEMRETTVYDPFTAFQEVHQQLQFKLNVLTRTMNSIHDIYKFFHHEG